MHKLKRKTLGIFFGILFIMIFIIGDVQAQTPESHIVSKNKVWKISFNQEIDFDDNAVKAITVKTKKGDKVNIRIKPGENKKSILVMPPLRMYDEGESYTLTVDKNIYSVNKNKLKRKIEIEFNIASEDIFKGMTKINFNDSVVSQDGKKYVISDIHKLNSIGEKPLDEYGWKVALYKANRSEAMRPVIKNAEGAKEIPIPLKLKGWMGVYIGYLSDTNEFKVKYKENEVTFKNIKNEKVINQGKYLNEAFMFAENFNEDSISIVPVEGKSAQIAYIKLVSLNDNQVAIYKSKNYGGNKGVIFDNDGYTDFFWGKYPDVKSLEDLPVNLVSKVNAEEISWTLGTTGLLNYHSAYAGPAFLGTEKYDEQVRKGDILAREQILNILNTGKSPLEILAQKSKGLGLKVNASLRMNTFYNTDSTKFLNGAMYEYYQDCLQKKGYSLSYYYPRFREYILNILKEVSVTENVDGLTLDFCRYPFVMGDEATQTEKVKIMNSFIREVRKEIPSKKITVRFPYLNPISYGLDVETWVKEKLVDRIVPSVLSYEEFFDFDQYSNLVKGTGVEIYIGISANLKGVDLTPETEELMNSGKYIPDNKYVPVEEYLYRANEAYNGGAKGVFLFNTLNDLDLTKDVPPKFKLLRDRIEVRKWCEFEYPAYLVNYKVDWSF
ncbi:MAG: hypothetical protein VB130_00595 [Clostridium sp.]|nr:hypothetical protein [Clostridium sp.]